MECGAAQLARMAMMVAATCGGNERRKFLRGNDKGNGGGVAQLARLARIAAVPARQGM